MSEESYWEKGIRKLKSEPLVPIGALATVIFLRYHTVGSHSDHFFRY